MFLSSYEKLRENIVENKFVDTMLHLGPRAFEEIGGEVVQSTSFVLRNSYVQDGEGIYLRLVEHSNASETREGTLKAVQDQTVSYRYPFNQENLNKIPGSPVAYWAEYNLLKAFEKYDRIESIGDAKSGLQTGNNEKFLKFWFEIEYGNIGYGIANLHEVKKCNYKWFPHVKGGSYRKWYGNFDYVINYGNDGEEIKRHKSSVIRSPQYYLFSKRYYL